MTDRKRPSKGFRRRIRAEKARIRRAASMPEEREERLRAFRSTLPKKQ